MTLYEPSAGSKSGVLIFKELRDWDKAEDALGRRNGPSWVPLEAKIGRGKPKHFVYMGDLLVADDDAWRLLRPEIEHEVEDLPILVSGAVLHIFNILNVVDCPDREHSKFIRLPHDPGIGEVLHPIYQEDKLTGQFLFTIPQKPRDILATAAFKDLVERHKLKNTVFSELASPLAGLINPGMMTSNDA